MGAIGKIMCIVYRCQWQTEVSKYSMVCLYLYH